MAFYHFRRISVDFAIIEVGVGGTWDASNIIQQPLISIIVSISLDHQRMLGNTIEQIAADKCGIIKRKRPIVIGQTVPHSIAKAKADAMQSELYQLDKQQKFSTFDEHNTALAQYVLTVLNSKYFILPKDIDTDDKIKQILAIRPVCRMEQFEINLHKLFKTLLHSKDLLSVMNRKWLKKFISTEIEYNKYKDRVHSIQCVLDVAHNPEAFRQLFVSLTKRFDPKQFKYRVVLTINPYKELQDCCRVVTQYADFIHCVSSKHEGYCLEVGKLKSMLVENCGFDEERVSVKGDGEVFVELMYALNGCYLNNNFMPLSESEVSTGTESVSRELTMEEKTVKEKLDRYKTEILVVCGSFHIMDEVRKGLGLRYDDDADDLAEYEKNTEVWGTTAKEF